MGRPWIEDAKEFHILGELKGASLHLTEVMKEYLAHDNAQKTVLLAPKGCGKTLLIKHKRRTLQDRGYALLPSNQLVSLAPGYAPPFSQKSTKHFRESPQYWSMLWQIAICIAVLRNAGTRIAALDNLELKTIFDNEALVDPFHIFIQLLYFDPGAYSDAVRDFQAFLMPAFASCHSPVALFIDNIDECFGHHLLRERRTGLHGQIANEFWHDAQVGLLMATRQIGSQNPHVKVFATIRTEAFSARESSIPDLANVRAHVVSLRFDYDDLRNIFIENIKQESRSRLAEPDARDPFVRFLGQDSVHMRHIYTGRSEHIFDYIYRHTFGRPRDLMTIGREISGIRAERRTNEEVRSAVNRASAAIATSYITEVSPHLNWFDEEGLFSLFDGNYYDTDAVNDIKGRYDARNRNGRAGLDSEGADGEGAIADLYASGLLGAARSHPVNKGSFQQFQSVFDLNCSVQRHIQKAPKANYYLLHNALGSLLRHRNASSRWRAHTVNIVSPNHTWIEPENLFYIVQLDVSGSTRVTEESVRGGMFSDILRTICDEVLEEFEYREQVRGDSLAFADRNGYVVVRAAHRIAEKLKASILNADVRVGLDFGPMMPETGKGTSFRWFREGRPLVRSARLQASSSAGYLLTLPSVAASIRNGWEVDWPFQDIVEIDAPFRAAKEENGWRVMEKGEDAHEHVDALMALPLLKMLLE